ncbi:Dcp1p-Dcp2p decapping enzyme complex alpha subunit [Gurleya vavrai]
METEFDVSTIGQLLTENDSKKILKQINSFISINQSQNLEKTDFPGSHPITLLKKHIDFLLNENYYVCEKSDGIRVLLYIFTHNNKPYSFFVDRKSKVYSIKIDFCPIKNTLFDGELYVDIIDNKKHLVYAIFDTLLFNCENVMKLNFQERLGYSNLFISNKPKSPFLNIISKKMFVSYGFKEIYESISELNHKNDGLIFTPVDLPYIPGRCDKLFKWKPAHLNTADFLLKKVKDHDFFYELLLFGKFNELKIFSYFTDFDGENGSRLDNKIVEMIYKEDKITLDSCSHGEIKGGWEIYKIRTDKETPNSHKVVMNVLYSLKESLNFKNLEYYYLQMRNNWKQREKNKN